MPTNSVNQHDGGTESGGKSLPPASADSGQVEDAGLLRSLVYLTALTAAVHPISNADFWWELTRGRIAAAGVITPSAQLIANSCQTESFWLSGLPLFGIYSFGGWHGLMFLKIMAAILFARMLIGKHLRPMVSHFTIAAAAITAAQMSWEPGPLFYDVLGMSVLASIAFRSRDRFSAGELLMVVLVFCFWANFGHRFIVGTMLFLPGLCSRIIFVTRRSQAPDSDGRSTPGEPFGLRRAHCVIRDFRTTLVHGMGVCIPAIAACCISPAGTNGLWQSWAITFPQSVISATFLRPSGWQPWFDSLDSAEAVGLIVLTIVSCHRILYASDLRLCVILGIAHFLAIASKENLPVAAAWIAIYYVNSATSKSSPVPNSDRASHESDFSPDQVSRGRQLAAAVILFLAMCGLFRWPNSVSGPGWGLDAQLSPDAFSASVQNLRVSGNAHCVGTREAGLLSWHCPDGLLPLDTPLTALLNGRLRQHVLFTQDLISGWKTVHRRPDGSEGGWWNAAQNF
ncbi:MAG: hypothetical protein KDB01_17730, partial [Planctomycetaceae bacterium]|nr:hypothetical protein [Planctomycetaceae bacterium]